MADPERSAAEGVNSGTGLITNPITGVASVEAPSNIGTVYSTHWAEAASQPRNPQTADGEFEGRLAGSYDLGGVDVVDDGGAGALASGSMATTALPFDA